MSLWATEPLTPAQCGRFAMICSDRGCVRSSGSPIWLKTTEGQVYLCYRCGSPMQRVDPDEVLKVGRHFAKVREGLGHTASHCDRHAAYDPVCFRCARANDFGWGSRPKLPSGDYYQTLADAQGITRAEAKARYWARAYGAGDRLREQIEGRLDRARIERIARTEYTRAANAVAIEKARFLGATHVAWDLATPGADYTHALKITGSPHPYDSSPRCYVDDGRTATDFVINFLGKPFEDSMGAITKRISLALQQMTDDMLRKGLSVKTEIPTGITAKEKNMKGPIYYVRTGGQMNGLGVQFTGKGAEKLATTHATEQCKASGQTYEILKVVKRVRRKPQPIVVEKA